MRLGGGDDGEEPELDKDEQTGDEDDEEEKIEHNDDDFEDVALWVSR